MTSPTSHSSTRRSASPALIAIGLAIVVLLGFQTFRSKDTVKIEPASANPEMLKAINNEAESNERLIASNERLIASNDEIVKMLDAAAKALTAPPATTPATTPANPSTAATPSSDEDGDSASSPAASASTPATGFVDTCWNTIGKVSKGATVKVPAGCQIKGDVKIDGTWFYDTNAKTCQVTVMEKDATVIAKYGADVSSRSPESLKGDGCGAGIRVDIKRWPSDLGKFPLTKTG